MSQLPIYLSLKIAFWAIALALIPSIGIALCMRKSSILLATMLEVLLYLPLTLPPVVIGLMLLKILSLSFLVDHHLIQALGPFVMHWKGGVLVGFIYSVPLISQAVYLNLQKIDKELYQLAKTFALPNYRVFKFITFPAIKNGLLQGATLSFLRCLGEFGATALVCGIIPEQTETISLSIYNKILQGKDEDALLLSIVSIGISALCIFFMKYLQHRDNNR